MRYFKIFVFFLLVCFFAQSGCNNDDDQGPTGPSHGLNADTYMPLKVGALWTYVISGSVEGEVFTDTTTGTIFGTTTVEENNKTYFILGGSGEDSIYLRIENNIVYQFSPGEFQELPYFNFNKEVGQSWEIFNESNPLGSMTVIGKFLGTEDIIVPAGTFTNCAKFENIVSVIIFNPSETFEGTDIVWLAPNVGIVKRIAENDMMGTSTEELIDYSIPISK